MSFKPATVLLCFSALLLVGACGKKEGVIPTAHRISQVFSEEHITFEGQPYYDCENHLSQQWNWDDDLLFRIDYRDNPPYSEVLYHDGSRLVATRVLAYGVRTELSYDGRKLETIDCFRNDTLFARYAFHHDGQQMTGFDLTIYDSAAAAPRSLIRTALPLDDALVSYLDADFRNLSRQIAAKSGSVVHYDFQWDDEDLVQVVCRSDNQTLWSASITYDDKLNPYAQLFGYREFSNPVSDADFRCFSRHNVLSISRTPAGVAPDYTYTYTYDGDWPLSRTLTYDIVGSNNDGLVVGVFHYAISDHYNYD